MKREDRAVRRSLGSWAIRKLARVIVAVRRALREEFILMELESVGLYRCPRCDFNHVKGTECPS